MCSLLKRARCTPHKAPRPDLCHRTMPTLHSRVCNRRLSSFKSLTCILLSFILPPPTRVSPALLLPLSPCGFCHLFTDEWPLHRHDLNVSLPLSLWLSPTPLPSLLLLATRISSCSSGSISQIVSYSFFFFFPPQPTVFCWLVLSCSVGAIPSRVTTFLPKSSKLCTWLLCIPVEKGWVMTDSVCKRDMALNALDALLSPSSLSRPDLATLVPLWSIHQMQLCIRVTGASSAIDPGASHLRKCQAENWQENRK